MQRAHADADVASWTQDPDMANPEQGIPEPEDADAFKARIQQLIDRYEAQYLPRKQRKVTADQIREVDEGKRVLTLVFLTVTAGTHSACKDECVSRCVPRRCHRDGVT